MSSSGITLSALSYVHPDGTVAVQDLDAVVPAGRIGLVGRNGSGKTTLLRLIAGELRPTSGSSTVRGRSTARVRPT